MWSRRLTTKKSNPPTNPKRILKISNRAGTDILISRRFASSFFLSDDFVVPGFIQRLTLTPGPTSPFLSSVTLVNVYLPCGSGTGPSTERAEALAKLTATMNFAVQNLQNFAGHCNGLTSGDRCASAELLCGRDITFQLQNHVVLDNASSKY
jgi:hypothetical protein